MGSKKKWKEVFVMLRKARRQQLSAKRVRGLKTSVAVKMTCWSTFSDIFVKVTGTRVLCPFARHTLTVIWINRCRALQDRDVNKLSLSYVS